MQYVTGVYALNLPSPDGTPGDWHFSALNWEKLKISESENSIFGDWGLNIVDVPNHGSMLVANHIRACLDLIEQGNFGTAQGMKNNFIDDDKYTMTVFSKVIQLRNSLHWERIDSFMGKEYFCQWLDFKKQVEV
ncbi:TPA: hypothetical protein TUY03_000796 [Streptococcus equi subsp. zooepidemicus]|nr:hypothetical protein [Streptococcus equi subsp. zooepidemicus]HEL0295734.1 hypothetical protein [Streptococcus equi subsp. zooepidemicus]HEL0622990.1 hypothetical protein [Streptococcus equi subsp. zooepidemicus]HEL0714370.1 hypothetical protein [Streptococcus equi subsp. zooepidemicus]HEL0743488.1 hypothetical protein [Streptococcus equi subsp. zooepidemicus]